MFIRRCFKWGSRWCKNLCNGSSFHTCRGPKDSTSGVWRGSGNEGCFKNLVEPQGTQCLLQCADSAHWQKSSISYILHMPASALFHLAEGLLQCSHSAHSVLTTVLTQFSLVKTTHFAISHKNDFLSLNSFNCISQKCCVFTVRTV